MSNAKKSITGTDDLLKKVFESQEMDDVVARMKRVQSGANHPSKPKTAKNPMDPSSYQPKDQETDQPSDQAKDSTLSHGISDGMSNGPAVHPTVHPSVRPLVHPTVGTSFHPSVGTTHYPTSDTSPYPTQWKDNASDPIWALTTRQATVLFYLINQPDSIAQKGRISNETEIPLPTIKHCINALVKDGFISKPTKYVNRSFQGFTYTINQSMCRQFIEKRGHEFSGVYGYPTVGISHYPTPCPSAGMSDGISNGSSHGLSNHYSSSLESNKTTTNLETLLKTDPELSYWQEKGLQPQQVQKWLEETGMSEILMIQALKYCRFEMVDNDFEESKPVQNVFNWFYKIIKRTGHYPKPTSYKSWPEKMMEIEQALLEEQEAEIRRLEELRTRRYKLEAERKFQEMMNEPNGATYQSVYERLSAFEKELGEGLAFEKAMRSRFDELFVSPGS
ncbi:MAG: hypothetical protein PHI97_02410 [Desulfobulbus sp.]|nr:hypothetical protein [Desulfobulbus sp.]